VIDYTEGRQWSLTLRQPLYRNSQIPIPFFPVLIKHRERLKAIGTFHMAFVDQKMFGVSMPDEPVAELLQFSVDFVEKTVIPALTPFLNK
jgi:hypothetical protein